MDTFDTFNKEVIHSQAGCFSHGSKGGILLSKPSI